MPSAITFMKLKGKKGFGKKGFVSKKKKKANGTTEVLGAYCFMPTMFLFGICRSHHDRASETTDPGNLKETDITRITGHPDSSFQVFELLRQPG